jgi:hypothetical protein
MMRFIFKARSYDEKFQHILLSFSKLEPAIFAPGPSRRNKMRGRRRRGSKEKNMKEENEKRRKIWMKRMKRIRE